MPIGNSKAGLFGGKSLVPGGSQTFNSPGTFTVPTGVTKVTITGTGQPGNPGNPGTCASGSPSRPASGGAGGGGGAGIRNTHYEYYPGYGGPGQPTCCNHTYRAGLGGGSGGGNSYVPWSTPSFPGNPWPAGGQFPPGSHYAYCAPGQPGQPGQPGLSGSGGNPGNTGSSSSGLGYTFPGGGGGSGGTAGTSGVGGSGGGGGGKGGTTHRYHCWGGQPVNYGASPWLGGPGGHGATGAGNGAQGDYGYCNTTVHRGGGGAGTETAAVPGFQRCPCNNHFYRPSFHPRPSGQGGGFISSSHHQPYSYCPCTGIYCWGKHEQYTTYTGGQGGGNHQGGGGAMHDTQSSHSPVPSFNFGSYPTTSATAVFRSGGGGGGGGESETNDGGGGGGGGGRGTGASGAGAGNPGSPANPATYPNVAVQPGGSYPISASSPGSVTISWDPQ